MVYIFFIELCRRIAEIYQHFAYEFQFSLHLYMSKKKDIRLLGIDMIATDFESLKMVSN